MPKPKLKPRNKKQQQIDELLDRVEILEETVDAICIKQRHLRKALDKLLEESQ
jgi:hypothetical protein